MGGGRYEITANPIDIPPIGEQFVHVSNLNQALVELDAYHRRLAQLKYKLEAGERSGLMMEAAAYIDQLMEIEVEMPGLSLAVEALITDYRRFIRGFHEVS
jgi:hypothetical protein